MLNILNMIVLINNKVTGHVQELNIKCTTGNLIILAEVVIYNPQTKENVTGFYAIESITTVKKKTYINLVELDYSSSFSSSEKVIDIRDFKKKIKI